MQKLVSEILCIDCLIAGSFLKKFYNVLILTGNCPDPSIRLVNEDGANSADGRIELCDNGAWGTVNSNEFSVKDAKAACRQLGLNSPRT